MDGRPSSIPASAGISIVVDDIGWRRAVRHADTVVRRAAGVANVHATIVLTSDRVVRRLNARHRDSDRATNVLTFDPLAPGHPGEIVLALGTVRREARAARRRVSDHLAHLIIHGSLHLRGHDHHRAGDARRMEQVEARLMSRLGRPNPWKHP